MAIIFQNDFSNQGDFNKWKNSFSSKWKWAENPPHSRLLGVANLSVGYFQYGLISEPIPLNGNEINGGQVSISFDADFDLHQMANFNIKISKDDGVLWYTYELSFDHQKKSIRHTDLQIALIQDLVPEIGETWNILVQFELETQINDTTSKINISSIRIESPRSGGGDGTTGTKAPSPPPNP